MEGEELHVNVPGFDGGDRTAIGLPAAQNAALERAAATGKPVVVVLLSGSAVACRRSVARAVTVNALPREACLLLLASRVVCWPLGRVRRRVISKFCA